MILNEEQKKEFFKNWNCGDLSALDYLNSIADTEELEELSYHAIKLNNMQIIIESEDWRTFQRHAKLIEDLYYAIKMELFNAVGITDEDWEKDW